MRARARRIARIAGEVLADVVHVPRSSAYIVDCLCVDVSVVLVVPVLLRGGHDHWVVLESDGESPLPLSNDRFSGHLRRLVGQLSTRSLLRTWFYHGLEVSHELES